MDPDLRPFADAVLSTIAAGTTSVYPLSLHDALPILRIKVSERDEDVTVNVPISLALSVLPDSGGSITASQAVRSEEHTSELQSPCNLVCRLLLETKKRLRTPSCSCCSPRCHWSSASS